jgi:MerR family transcriptional regulator, copper efflux regulator
MLRYIEESGLVEPQRSAAGYRLYGPGELQRLRTLRQLVTDFGIELSDVGFALRLGEEAELREAVEAWLSAEVVRPEVPAGEWLRFEQSKHMQLLNQTRQNPRRETAPAAGTRAARRRKEIA